MIRRLADFAPPAVEAGVGLALQDQAGRYLFFLAGARHQPPPGELFYAGIGGHREPGETWFACAQREAEEEIGQQVILFSARRTWHVSQGQPPQKVKLEEWPRPLALYEMIHPPDAPRAGELYRLVVFRGRLAGPPHALQPDEVQGLIALTGEQVIASLEEHPTLAHLLDRGAEIVAGAENIDGAVRLYPLGTAAALGRILRLVGVEEMAGEYALRPATREDADFIYQVKRAGLKAYVDAIWGWKETDQRRRFAASFSPEKTHIIVVHGRDVGAMMVEQEAQAVYLAGIYLQPDAQGKGTGTAVVLDLIAQARDRGRPVRLQVLKLNPAREWYSGLGFVLVEETETHYIMRTEE